MPTKKNRQKANGRRKPASRGTTLTSMSPFPRMRQVRHEYCENVIMTEAAVGTGVQQLWNLNSLYDPNATGVGHQPLYYDQLFSATGPYQRYTVSNVVWRLTATNVGTSPALVVTYFQPGTVDLPSKDAAMEKPLCKWFVLSPAGGAPTVRTVVTPLQISGVFGVPLRKLMDDDQYSGFWNSNPAQIAYGVTMVYSLGGTVANVVTTNALVYSGRAYGVCATSSS